MEQSNPYQAPDSKSLPDLKPITKRQKHFGTLVVGTGAIVSFIWIAQIVAEAITQNRYGGISLASFVLPGTLVISLVTAIFYFAKDKKVSFWLFSIHCALMVLSAYLGIQVTMVCFAYALFALITSRYFIWQGILR